MIDRLLHKRFKVMPHFFYHSQFFIYKFIRVNTCRANTCRHSLVYTLINVFSPIKATNYETQYIKGDMLGHRFDGTIIVRRIMGFVVRHRFGRLQHGHQRQHADLSSAPAFTAVVRRMDTRLGLGLSHLQRALLSPGDTHTPLTRSASPTRHTPAAQHRRKQ